VDTLNAYPHLLHQRLKEQYPFAVINVIVTAIGGEDSVSGAARFESDVLSHQPELVLMDYAGNDRRLGLDPAREAWSAMIEQAAAWGARMILLTPTGDLSAELDDPNDPLNQHAAQIRQLAATYGVGLADSLAALQQYIHAGGTLADLMSQVNHPNRKGHELVVTELIKWFPASRTAAAR
jgi:lysophospholipase L1-like esterase